MESNPPKITKIQTACPDGYLTTRNRPTLCVWSGLLVGVLVILLAWTIGYLPSGRLLNDPLQIALVIGSITGGFLYFNWASFFTSLAVSGVIGVTAWLVLLGLASRSGVRVMSEEARRAAITAIVISVIPIWAQEVDALQVLLWYGMATFFSVSLAGFAARFLHRLFF